MCDSRIGALLSRKHMRHVVIQHQCPHNILHLVLSLSLSAWLLVTCHCMHACVHAASCCVQVVPACNCDSSWPVQAHVMHGTGRAQLCCMSIALGHIQRRVMRDFYHQ
jgi:hypothetical protein